MTAFGRFGRRKLLQLSALALGLTASGCAGSSSAVQHARTTTVVVTAPAPAKPAVQQVARTTTVVVTAPAKPAAGPSATTPALQSGYSLQTFADDGSAVVLDDGSIWSIDAADQSTVTGWSSGDSLTIGSGGRSLTNDGTGETVGATDMGSGSGYGKPYPNAGDHSISALADDGSVLTLDDGSIWAIDAGGQSDVSTWTDGDSVTVNRDPAGYGYILVNTDQSTTVSGSYLDGAVSLPSANGSAPASFCSTHACIASFYNGTGYIVQCADREWSHSGGRPGACSYHGGETGRTYP